MDEYISREAVLKKQTIITERYHAQGADEEYDHKVVRSEDIRAIPAADVKPVVRGEWKQTGDHSAVCTACGKTTLVGGVDRTGKALIHKGLFNFCPNCGADMRKEVNDERGVE